MLAANSEVPGVLVAEAGRRISHRVKCAVENLLAHEILRTRSRRPGLSLVHNLRCIRERRRNGRKREGGSKDNLGGGLHG